MKALIFLCLFVLVFGVSCASTVEQNKKPLASTQPVNVTSPLLRPGFTLSAVIQAKKPLAEHAYLLAQSKDAEFEIRKASEVAAIINEIKTEADALAYVRLLASQEFRPFLQDVYYTEIHQQTGKDDQWFALEPQQYADWQVQAPVVKVDNGIYVIERFVACYPRIMLGKSMTQAKLAKIREWVAPDGQYAAEILNTIAEGDAIQKILLFTK